MGEDFAILRTGQLWGRAATLPSFQGLFSPAHFQVLSLVSQLDGSSFHTKPETDSCTASASVRVTNSPESGIGVPVRMECKGRMFMAESVTGEPVVIAAFYHGDSGLNTKALQAALPRRKGESLIKLPHTLTAKSRNKIDPGDRISIEDPYKHAAQALQLGLGQVNPISVILRAKELGVKVLCVFDKELSRTKEPITNNGGSRVIGTFVENGADYIDNAIALSEEVEIAGYKIPGFVVANIAQRDTGIRDFSAIGSVYQASQVFEGKGNPEAWQAFARAVENSRTARSSTEL